MKNNNKPRIHSIDFLRSLAFFLVLLNHVGFAVNDLTNYEYVYNPNQYGAIGVSFFIIISGFSLYYTNQSKLDIKNFYIKRIANILPYFWIAYVFVAAFLFLTLGYITIKSNLKNALISFLAMDGYLNGEYYLVGEWFTGFILLVYILYPIIWFSFCKNSIMTFVVSIVIGSLCMYYTPYLHEHVWSWRSHSMQNPFSRLPEFIFGMLIVKYLLNNKKLAYFMLIPSVIYLFFMMFDWDCMNNFIRVPKWISLFIIIYVIYDLIPTINILNNIVTFLSKYSFMAFLLHHQIIYSVFRYVNPSNFSQHDFIYSYLMIAFFSYLTAYLLYPLGDKIKISLINSFNYAKK